MYEAIQVLWFNLTTALSVQVLVMSSLVLFCALALEVWLQAVALSFLNETRLNEIEAKHPHLPSLKAIIMMFLCSSILLVVALNSAVSRPLFQGPYESLMLVGVFILVSSAGALAELRWHGAKTYAFSFILGTALALLFRVCAVTFVVGHFLAAGLLIFLLVAVVMLAWRVFLKTWTAGAQVFFLVTFITWYALLLL